MTHLSKEHPLVKYILQLADNAMILSQRLSAWCGHGPILEQDIALTNISLDILGQARLWYQYAAELLNDGTTEDDLAYLRDSHEFMNAVLVEVPNGDWGQTVVRQCIYDTFQLALLTELQHSNEPNIAAIARKCLPETTYHFRWSTEWLIRLGDGTEESHQRMQTAVDNIWRFSYDLITPSIADEEIRTLGIGPDLSSIGMTFASKIQEVMINATLTLPDDSHQVTGGKMGVHTEYLGYILAEMQVLQRTYPGLTW